MICAGYWALSPHLREWACTHNATLIYAYDAYDCLRAHTLTQCYCAFPGIVSSPSHLQLQQRKANERKIEGLLKDVQDMKRQKVQLVKKMRDEAERNKEKEV